MDAAQVGLRKMHYALLTQDDVTGAVYQTPVPISPAINAKITPKSSSSILYADDGAADAATAVGEVEIEIETKSLPLAIQAILLGHTLAGGVITRKSTDVAPFVALGFESAKSNGKKRYYWFFKGKFLVPDEDLKTKADKVEFQTPKIKGVFVKRDFDDAYQKVADEEDPGYTAAVGTNWYSVVEGVKDVTAPTLTVVPANNAATVAVGSTVVWTFSEAILDSAVNAGNFALINDATGANIAGALSLNAAKTVVTFTPSVNLAAATAHRAIVTVGVKDLAGNPLAAPSVTKFTTA